MKLACKNTRYWRPLAVIATLLVVLMAQPALAVTKNWVGPTTNNLWNNPNNWSPMGVPVAGDDAFVTDGTQTVTYTNAVNPLLNSVIVDSAAGTMTLTQTYYPTGNLSATAETIGLAGIGVYNQSAGSNTVGSVAGTPIANTTLDRTLVLGFRPGSSGTYNKNGGTLTTFDLMVGRAGTGTFNQPFGNVTVNNNLILGNNAAGNGTYKMSSGGLSVGNAETIGNNGTGLFTQSAGNHTVGGNFFVARNGGSGTFNMSSGVLQIGGDAFIGREGTGTFNMSSGTISVGGNESIGGFDAANPANSTVGTGTFNQTSGAHTITGDLFLGAFGASSGTFKMTSGSLTVGGQEIIGKGAGSTGMFTQTSGAHTIAGPLTIGTASGTGTYNLTSGSLTSNNTPPFDATADIQINSTGTFNANGGTITGDVDNLGHVKTTNADVTWNGNFVNHNSYVSDPSTQTFNNDLVNDTNGFLVATHNQDLFVVKGDFINTSTQGGPWDTAAARLRFAKGGVGNDTIHEFDIVGADNGPTGTNDFAWRLLNINNQTINLKDTDGVGGGALYLKVLNGADITGSTVNNIFGDLLSVLNIYYDPALNPTFGGLTYDFANGPGHGQLIPDPPLATPLPASVLLMGSGLLGLGLLGWRRKRIKA